VKIEVNNERMFIPDCVCNYCKKKKEGVCGLMSHRVKECKRFSFFGEKHLNSVTLKTAKDIRKLIGV